MSHQRFSAQVWGSLLRAQWGHKVDLKDSAFTTWLVAAGEDGAAPLGDGGAKMLGRAPREELGAHLGQAPPPPPPPSY